MTRKPSPLTATVLAALAALAGCAPPSGGPGNRGAGSDRGPLEDNERLDVARLRDAAFTSADPAYIPSATPLIEDPHTSPQIGNKSRLSYSAIRHSGYLASIPTHNTSSVEGAAAYGTDLANRPDMLWGPLSGCPFSPNIPRWSLNNIETNFALPDATDTQAPSQIQTPAPTPGKPADPLHRYSVNNWQILPLGPDENNGDPLQIAAESATPTGWDVHEYYLRQPLIPNDFGSRVITAWLSRFGRIGMIRNQHDLWGFGSISEARTTDFRVLFEGEGRFLPRALPITSPSDFLGTFIYRINPNRPPRRPSFWPGAPQSVPGNRPITWGWSFDPETGERVGMAIHCAGIDPLCTVTFGIRFDPYADAQLNPFQPEPSSDGNGIVARSRDDFEETNPTPQIYIDNDPAKPLYPIDYKVYVPSCAVAAGTAVFAADNNTTRILPPAANNIIIESALQSNEVIIVPQLNKDWIKNGLPNGTYRIHIEITHPQNCLEVQVPTADTDTQWRYFHVWNGATPSFFRP